MAANTHDHHGSYCSATTVPAPRRQRLHCTRSGAATTFINGSACTVNDASTAAARTCNHSRPPLRNAATIDAEPSFVVLPTSSQQRLRTAIAAKTSTCEGETEPTRTHASSHGNHLLHRANAAATASQNNSENAGNIEPPCTCLICSKHHLQSRKKRSASTTTNQPEPQL
ncbi:hypothetical protein DEO72_LG5g1282 [Vigna unguiculata]|uniref:Uncharacterized protein n=1 Tax=Vigna unguiculata TaxID=3917 RepID=A0A4D6LXJ7_VIGUN|nr:hypothetical protein DEO72_LG5g1282 [Vigna unguiculata]